MATFMHDDGNGDSMTLRMEEAKMVTDIHKVNFINHKCLENKIHRRVCGSDKDEGSENLCLLRYGELFIYTDHLMFLERVIYGRLQRAGDLARMMSHNCEL